MYTGVPLPPSIDFGDFDGDGYLDIVTGGVPLTSDDLPAMVLIQR